MMHWNVVEVKPEKDLSLWVRFADNTSGLVKFTPAYLTGVFEPLQNPQFFNTVFLSYGAVSWPGDIDLAPDSMYAEIKHHGQWIL